MSADVTVSPPPSLTGRWLRRLRRLALGTLALFLVAFVLPLGTRAVHHWYGGGHQMSWSQADWSSAALLPDPAASEEAMIRIYAARTGRWRGVVAHHSWIVVKAAGERAYTRHDKVGWGRMPVRVNGWAPDARWFSHEPETVLALNGERAERLIPRIAEAVEAYPFAGEGGYRAWPGPNSNSFVAHVLEEVPELGAALPSTALGRDWAGGGFGIGRSMSGTGLRIAFGGYGGLAIGLVEGIEIHVLGLVAGIDPLRLGIKLPGWGDLHLLRDDDAAP
jgi:hypothetical protein